MTLHDTGKAFALGGPDYVDPLPNLEGIRTEFLPEGVLGCIGCPQLDEMAADLASVGLAEEDRRFNLSWHDWMNLENLILVSRSICVAAIARENSRGAHFRDDFPEAGDLETSTYTVARLQDGEMTVENRPVEFTRIRPGESLIEEDAA